MRECGKRTETKAKMATSLRIKDGEQEKIRKKCIEINKLLVRHEKAPLKDSELGHILLDLALDMCELNKNGEIILVEK